MLKLIQKDMVFAGTSWITNVAFVRVQCTHTEYILNLFIMALPRLVLHIVTAAKCVTLRVVSDKVFPANLFDNFNAKINQIIFLVSAPRTHTFVRRAVGTYISRTWYATSVRERCQSSLLSFHWRVAVRVRSRTMYKQ